MIHCGGARVVSSAGRARRSPRRGHWFESSTTHHSPLLIYLRSGIFVAARRCASRQPPRLSTTARAGNATVALGTMGAQSDSRMYLCLRILYTAANLTRWSRHNWQGSTRSREEYDHTHAPAPRAPYALGPRVVSHLPAVPHAPSARGGQAAGGVGEGPRLRLLHARRPDHRARRLSRGTAREHRALAGVGTAGAHSGRSLVSPAGRIPRRR